MNKKAYYTMMMLMIFVFTAMAYFSYLALYPFKTLKVKSAIVQNTPIKAGSLLVYQVDYCKYTEKPAIVYRTLHSIDETQSVPFPSISSITVPGCHITNVPLQTFPSIVPGMYYLLIDADFQISTQRDIHIKFRTDNFKIIN